MPLKSQKWQPAIPWHTIRNWILSSTKKEGHTLIIELASVVGVSCRSEKGIAIPDTSVEVIGVGVCRGSERKSMLGRIYTYNVAFHVCSTQTHHSQTVIVNHKGICQLPCIDLVIKSRFFKWLIKHAIQTYRQERAANESNLHPKNLDDFRLWKMWFTKKVRPG